jgi:hypothetical protein
VAIRSVILVALTPSPPPPLPPFSNGQPSYGHTYANNENAAANDNNGERIA